MPALLTFKPSKDLASELSDSGIVFREIRSNGN